MTKARLVGNGQNFIRLINRHAKLWVLVLGALCHLVVLAYTTSFNDDNPALSLDNSWVMSLSPMLERNALVGRDTVFTYGPLSQLIGWIGAHLTPGTPTLDGLWTTYFAFTALGIVLLCLILALLPMVDWRGSAFILLVYPTGPYAFRPLALLVCAILIGMGPAIANRRKRLIASIGIGGLCIACQLLTFESGIYVLAAAFVVMIFYAVASRWRRLLNKHDLLPSAEYLAMFGITLATYLLGNVVISVLFKLTSDTYKSLFDYQHFSLELMRGYSSFAIPWEADMLTTVVLVVLTIYTCFVILTSLRRLTTAQSYVFLALLAIVLIPLKSTLVRSDIGHIVLGTRTLVLVFLIIGLCSPNPFIGRFRFGWSVLLICLFLVYPTSFVDDLRTLGQIAVDSGVVATQFFVNFNHQIAMDKMVPVDILRASDPTKRMLSFPYDNYIPLILGREMIAPTLQAYAAYTGAMQRKYVEGLEAAKSNLEIVYGIDRVATAPIDQVMQVTRTPIIFDYIYRNFGAKSPPDSPLGYVLLDHRTEPRTDINYKNLAFTEDRSPSGLRRYSLSQPASCSLLRVTERVTYPIQSIVGRQNPLTIDVFNEETLVTSQNLQVAEPGKTTQVYFELVEPRNFGQIFGEKPVQVRPFTRLEVGGVPTGFLEVDADLIDIEKIECVTFERKAATDKATPSPVQVVSQAGNVTRLSVQGLVDKPDEEVLVRQPFLLSGWAIDTKLGMGEGAGVDLIRVYEGGECAGNILAEGPLNVERPEVPKTMGRDASYRRSGFSIALNNLPKTKYSLAVCGRQTGTAAFGLIGIKTLYLSQMSHPLPNVLNKAYYFLTSTLINLSPLLFVAILALTVIDIGRHAWQDSHRDTPPNQQDTSRKKDDK